MIITAKHVKSARLWLDWDQRTLAERAGVSLPTIQRMEGSNGAVRGNYETVEKVRAALETAGIEFLNSDSPGVRLRKG